MPKPRKTRAQLDLSGAARRNPGRYAAKTDGPQFNGTLGDPPERLSTDEKAAWHELSDMVPEGVLWKSDRWVVELTACLIAKSRRQNDPKCVVCKGEGGFIGDRNKFMPCPRCSGLRTSEISILMKCLASMGLTPADRGKIDLTPKPDDENNPFAEISAENKRKVN